MDPRFSPHNLHLEGIDNFRQFDPQLRNLRHHPYIYRSPIVDELPWEGSGILTLAGGRQIGKTTLLKQWMLKLLEGGVAAKDIAFFSGEIIDDYQSLLHILNAHMLDVPANGRRFIIIDEVNYIKDWDKGIKFLADAGKLENVILMLTGSDLVFIKEARMRFPGRRGKLAKVDFSLYPLSFRESVDLCDTISDPYQAEQFARLTAQFDKYLLHGGFMTAINDMAEYGRIGEATLVTYSDWIRGDILKRGRSEHYLREIIGAIIKRYGSQVSWNALAKDLSVDHPKTVADYMAALESMDALVIQHALLEDKLSAAPKKPKKIFFTDPFIYHALNAWIQPTRQPFEEQMQKVQADDVKASQLVESILVAHYHRRFPTYYIKAEGEVDVAYIHNHRFWPIELKYSRQIRSKDLTQIAKYNNGKVLTRSNGHETIMGLPAQPVAIALWELG